MQLGIISFNIIIIHDFDLIKTNNIVGFYNLLPRLQNIIIIIT